MPPVKFKITTENEKSLANALMKNEKQIQSMQKKLDGAGKNGKKAFSKVGSEIQKVTEKLGGATGLAGAVAAVTTQLKAAYELTLKNQRIAKQTHLSAGEARANAILNLPADFKGGRQQLDEIVKKVHKTSKLETAKIWEAVGPALSAKGASSAKSFESALNLGSKLEMVTGARVNGGDMAASLLDLSKATGLEDAKANFSFLRQMGSASRMTTIKGQLNAVSGVKSAKARGESAERAMEYQAAISQMINDEIGEKTRTGFTNLTKTLFTKDLIPTSKVNNMTGKKELSWGTGSGNMDQRIKQLQEAYAKSDSSGQSAIERQLGGESAMSPFILNMLKNTKQYQNTMSTAEKQILAPSLTSSKATDKLFADAYSGTTGAVMRAEHRNRGQEENIFMGKGVGALNQQAWETYKKQTEAMGFYHIMPETMERGAMDIGAKMHGITGAEAIQRRAASLYEMKSSGMDAKTQKQFQTMIDLLGDIAVAAKAAKLGIPTEAPSPNAQEVD